MAKAAWERCRTLAERESAVTVEPTRLTVQVRANVS
jgi:hypothetical protein